jgi:hypothetical protein
MGTEDRGRTLSDESGPNFTALVRGPAVAADVTIDGHVVGRIVRVSGPEPRPASLGGHWSFRKGDTATSFQVEGKLTITASLGAIAAAVEGLGIVKVTPAGRRMLPFATSAPSLMLAIRNRTRPCKSESRAMTSRTAKVVAKPIRNIPRRFRRNVLQDCEGGVAGVLAHRVARRPFAEETFKDALHFRQRHSVAQPVELGREPFQLVDEGTLLGQANGRSARPHGTSG